MGQFNYGRRGILDVTHKRFFTVGSFRRLLESEGFCINKVRGFGPPLRDMVSDSGLFRLLDGFLAGLARIWPRLFAYQVLFEATRLESFEDIVGNTIEGVRQTDSDP